MDEKNRATMEAGRNAAEDAYFEARPQIDCNDRRKVFDAGYERGWEERNSSVMALQCKIDALMLEYCPDEMTEEQKSEWARHQQPVSDEEQRVIDSALGMPANVDVTGASGAFAAKRPCGQKG